MNLVGFPLRIESESLTLVTVSVATNHGLRTTNPARLCPGALTSISSYVYVE